MAEHKPAIIWRTPDSFDDDETTRWLPNPAQKNSPAKRRRWRRNAAVLHPSQASTLTPAALKRVTALIVSSSALVMLNLVVWQQLVVR